MAFRFPIKKHLSKTAWLAIILVLILIGAGIYLFQAGKIQKAGWLGKVKETAEKEKETKPQEEEKAKQEEAGPEAFKPEEPAKEIATAAIVEKEDSYEVKAEKGEGITHLARKALKKYLTEQAKETKLTPEHKVYAEDYIQNRLGDKWLNLAESMTISKDLVKEAISSSQQLTAEQLKSLNQFALQVPSLDY